MQYSKGFFCVFLFEGPLGHTELLMYLQVSSVGLPDYGGVEALQCLSRKLSQVQVDCCIDLELGSYKGSAR